MKYLAVMVLATGLSECAYFEDMPTGKGSYIWCTQQTQPVPACRNYGFDRNDGTENDN